MACADDEDVKVILAAAHAIENTDSRRQRKVTHSDSEHTDQFDSVLNYCS
jgi:hypothetical protein